MVLEAVMICCDNSEAMRNGDYMPSRLEAQNESVNYIANGKINGNAETTVGFLSMAGKRINVHSSPSRNFGQLMSCLTKMTIEGQSNFIGGLLTAHLCLKNRPNKNQRQRIIMFVGSELPNEVKELEKVGKMLKKNNVAVDVINFGTENSKNENVEKLEALIRAVNNNDNSHLVNIPPGPHAMSEMLLSTPVLADGAAAASSMNPAFYGGGAVGGGSGEVDPNLDPELAMVLKLSAEEARQSAGSSSSSGDAGAAPMDEDEDALLARAIALSMASEDNQATPSPAAAPAQQQEAISEALRDPDFINSLLDSVPGVDRSNMAIDDMLNQLSEDKPKDDADKSKDDKDKDASK